MKNGDCNFLIDLLSYISESNKELDFSDDAKDVLAFKKITKAQINKIIEKNKRGETIFQCCSELRGVEEFNPAFLSACSAKQFIFQDAKIGLICNFIEFVGNSELQDSDYISILLDAVISTLELEMDGLILSLFDNLCVLAQMINAYFTEQCMKKIIQFAKEHSEISSHTIPYLSFLLYNSVVYKNEEFIDELYSELNEILSKVDTPIPAFDELIRICVPSALSFDIRALNIIGVISDIDQNQSMINIFVSMANKACSEIIQAKTSSLELHETREYYMFTPKKINIPKDQEIFSLVPETIIEPNIEKLVDASNTRIESFFNDEQLRIIGIIRGFLHRTCSQPTLSFLFQLEKDLVNEGDKVVDLWCVSVAIIQAIPFVEIPDLLINTMINHSKVFDPSINIFEVDIDEMKNESRLRSLFIKTLLQFQSKKIKNLLINASAFPALFVEICCRILALVDFEDLTQFFDSSIADLFGYVMNTCIASLGDEKNEIPLKVWSGLFFFIITVFDDDATIQLFMSSYSFSHMFLSYLFSEHMHSRIQTIVKRFLISQNPTTLSIDHITQFCYMLLESSSPYVFEFVDLLQEVISHKSELTTVFSQLLPSVLNFLTKNHQRENVQPVLSFILCLSMNIELRFTSEQIRKLGTAIREAEPEGSSVQTITSLISIISNSKSSTQSGVFVIRKPALIQVLLSSSFSCLDSIIQMFYSLCKYSIYNRTQCHIGELDLFLIDALMKYPNGFSHAGIDYPKNFKQSTVDECIIPLLTIIFETKCSLQTVERFISLALPNVERVFPEHANDCILKLNSLLSSAPLTPKIFEVFQHGKPKYVFQHLPISILENGFTFIANIMFDKALAERKKEPVIFSADAGNNTEILLFSNNCNILCDVHQGDKDNTATFTNEFKSCQWYHFAVTFINVNDEKYRVVYTPGKEQSEIFIAVKPTYTVQEWTLEVGGFADWKTEAEIPFCFLGSFMFFDSPLTISQINEFVDATPTVEQKNIAETECLNDSLYMQNINNIAEKQPLFECLVPFYEFPSESPSNFLEQVTDLFMYLPAGKEFNGFRLILLKMNEYQPEFLTFSLYTHFAEVLCANQNEELFKYIVFNMRLWIKSPFINKIVVHWTNALYPASQGMFEAIKLTELISEVRALFWFKADELSEMVDERSKSIDVKQCREELNFLLLQLCKNRITDADFEFIISILHTINDDESLESFLVLVTYIADDLKNSQMYAAAFHKFLSTSNPKVFMAALKAIIVLSKDQVHMHIESILCQITNIKLTHEILQTVLDNAENSPEAIIIGALISTMLNSEDIDAFSRSFLTMSKKESNAARILKIRTWYIWPVIAALKSKEENYPLIVNAMLNVILNDLKMASLDEILAFIDILYLMNNMRAKKLRSEILGSIADYILTDSDNSECSAFIHRCSRYLLFQFNTDYSTSEVFDVIKHAFNVPETEEESREMFSPSSIEEIIQCLDAKRTNVHILFKVCTENGELQDNNLFARALAVARDIKKRDHSTILITNLLERICRKSLHGSDDWKQCVELSSAIAHYSSVMDISYMKFLNGTAESISQHLKKISKLLLADNNEANEGKVAEDAIKSLHERIEKINEELSIEYVHFNNEYAHEFSIWKTFWKSDYYITSSSLLTTSLQVATVQRRHKCLHEDFSALELEKEPKFHVPAVRIRLSGNYPCSFILTKTEIILKSKTKEIHIAQSSVTHVLHRTNKHLSCLEFVTESGKSYFIDFYPYSLADILPLMRKFNKPANCVYQDSTFYQFIFEQNLTKKWVHKRCSNLEYLIALNYFGGRTYRSLSSYIIMPVPYSNIEAMDHPNFNEQTEYLQGQFVFLPLFAQYKRSLDKRNKSATVTEEKVNEAELITIKNDKSKEALDHSHPLPPREVATPEEIAKHFTLDKIEEENKSKKLVDLLQEKKYLLTPEFFLFPECFNELELPKQFNTSLEFVHAMKKALESDYVTMHLPEWINCVFGINQSKMSRVITLFKVPHPKIHEDEKPELQDQTSVTISESTIDFATIVTLSSTELCIIASSSSDVSSYTVDFEEKTVHKKNHGKIAGVPHITNNSIQFTDASSGEISIVSERKVKVYQKINIPFFDFNGKTDTTPLLCTHDGLVFLLKNSDVFGVCKISPEVPVCVASSEKWHLTVVGVRSGQLIFFNREKGNLVLSAKVLNIPEHIIITESEGFVVSASGSFIEVFTPNGTYVNGITVSSDVACIESYRDRSGFDYIVVADQRGRVSVIDPFEKTEKEIFDCQSKIVAIRGSLLTGGLTIVAQVGEVFFVPL